MLKPTLLVCAAALLIAVPALSLTDPQTKTSHSAAPDPAQVRAGQALFLNNCLVCHSPNEGQVMVGPSLYHELAKPKPKKTPEEVKTILKNGKGKMPSFGAKLTPENMDQLIAYLRTV